MTPLTGHCRFCQSQGHTVGVVYCLGGTAFLVARGTPVHLGREGCDGSPIVGQARPGCIRGGSSTTHIDKVTGAQSNDRHHPRHQPISSIREIALINAHAMVLEHRGLGSIRAQQGHVDGVTFQKLIYCLLYFNGARRTSSEHSEEGWRWGVANQ